jgi:hypothetical protein
VLLLGSSLPTEAAAQARARIGTIDAGTTINVRTTETISADDSDGRIFSGVVDQNVLNRSGAVAIPRGSDVELVVNEVEGGDVALDLNAIVINNRRFTLVTDSSTLEAEDREGIGINKRTGKYVGGGAAIGAIIGAIAGGGKGAAIGAGVGAAAGAGTQVLTRGRSVEVPAETLLTFRLQQPLRPGLTNTSSLSSVDANQNYSAAYRAGLRAGRLDADRNLARNTRTNRFTTRQQRLDYAAGYNEGYSAVTEDSQDRFKPAPRSRGSVIIERDNDITWEAPGFSRLYVQMDNERPRLFAEGQRGTQHASWIQSGHRYIFILRDANDVEIARSQIDLR